MNAADGCYPHTTGFVQQVASCPACGSEWPLNLTPFHFPDCPNGLKKRASDRQEGGDHYQSKKVQPWDAMQAWMSREEFTGFLRGNVIKYVARCKDKGGLQDLKKARHYLDKLIETESE